MRGFVVYKKGPHLGVEVNGDVYLSIPKSKLRGNVFVGDFVEGEVIDDQHFRIDDVVDRKNLLPRPRVANVDKVLVVFSFKKPDLDPLHLDGILAVLEKEDIEPLIVLNKKDLVGEDEAKHWVDIYTGAGYDVITSSTITGEGLEGIRAKIKGQLTVLAGPSGSGKTSIINSFMPDLKLKVQEVGRYGKGRHTTTDITLVKNPDGGYICDTPGFAKFYIEEFVDYHELPRLYREFKRFTCKFSDCTHTGEPGCGVVGNIHPERYKTYMILLNRLKNVPRKRK
ncbi:MAG: ribosome small subunit-dependent GTPase A [candidate division WOR-3 bacterium]